MKRKIIGSILIIIPFILLQLMSYYGTYLQTENWREAFKSIFGVNILQILGYHLWIIIGICILIITLKKKNR